MQVQIIDFVVILFIGLFSVIGMCRGLIKSLFKTFTLFLIVFIPILICDFVTPYTKQWFGETINNSIVYDINSKEEYVVNGKNTFFYQNVDLTDYDNVRECYEKMGNSTFFANLFASFSFNSIKKYGTAKPIDVLPEYLSGFILKISTFVILMAITAVLLLILKSILTGIVKKNETLKVFDKIGGLILGFAFGVVLYSFLYFTITSLPLSFLKDFQKEISTQIALSAKNFQIASSLADSFLIRFFETYFNF